MKNSTVLEETMERAGDDGWLCGGQDRTYGRLEYRVCMHATTNMNGKESPLHLSE